MATHEIKPISLRELLESATVPSEIPQTHSNHAQILLQGDELYIDFYVVSPTPSGNNAPSAHLAHRIVLPASQAKGLATAIANVVAIAEKNSGTQLPNRRGADPEDIIKIWE